MFTTDHKAGQDAELENAIGGRHIADLIVCRVSYRRVENNAELKDA